MRIITCNVNAAIYTAEVFSDHAPVIIDYDYDLGKRPPRTRKGSMAR